MHSFTNFLLSFPYTLLGLVLYWIPIVVIEGSSVLSTLVIDFLGFLLSV